MPNELLYSLPNAILDEMNVWMPLLSEHLKLHRGGLDINPKQDCIFRNLDSAARQMDYLTSMIVSAGKSGTNAPKELTGIILPQVITVRDIKLFMYQGIEACQILSIIPPEQADHIRRETDRFIGIIGGPKPTREQLGIPGGDKIVLSVPRLMLADLSENEKFTALVEEIMFFSHINEEHAHITAMSTKPEIQERLAKKAKEFERLFNENMHKARAVEEKHRGLERLINETLKLMKDYRAFGMTLVEATQKCALPGHQLNTWPSLFDHVIREGDYFVELLMLGSKNL